MTPEQRTPDVILAAIRQDCFGALENVGKDELTPAMYLEAVTQCAYAIRLIPRSQITPVLCAAAVRQCYVVIEVMDPSQISYNIAVTALLGYISSPLQDTEWLSTVWNTIIPYDLKTLVVRCLYEIAKEKDVMAPCAEADLIRRLVCV
jgi:hypothetical protein